MVTINIYLRFALIFLFLVGGTVLAFTESIWYALPLILIGLVLLTGYILLGTVQSAAEMMQKMQFVEAEKRLELTYFPNLLYSANKAYYYLIKGTAAMNLKRVEEAEEHFLTAEGIGLPSDNERAMIKLQLAGFSAQKNKWNAAKKYYKEASKMDVTEPQIKEQLDEIGKALKQRGQMKHMRHGGQNFGGKRRRPKMR